ncbi:hypothetical protein NMY22_g10470 [Coprinellus aureogranulatus]|nr:hypothetical protein NMY22_g10470 [Coprinellus aureogranulatus]
MPKGPVNSVDILTQFQVTGRPPTSAHLPPYTSLYPYHLRRPHNAPPLLPTPLHPIRLIPAQTLSRGVSLHAQYLDLRPRGVDYVSQNVSISDDKTAEEELKRNPNAHPFRSTRLPSEYNRRFLPRIATRTVYYPFTMIPSRGMDTLSPVLTDSLHLQIKVFTSTIKRRLRRVSTE